MRLRTRGLPLRLTVLCILLLAPLSALQPAPATVAAAASNAIEDTFTRANQTGWGTSTNTDGVPNVAWDMDGNGSQSFVTISNTTGGYGYPGSTHVVGIASSGCAELGCPTWNGCDSVV